MLDRSPEWRAFDLEQRAKRSRVGARSTYAIHDKGLATAIGWKNRDAMGRAIPMRRRAQLYRLRKWQRRARVGSTKERNLTQALSTINRISTNLRLPNNVVETASIIYRQILQQNLIRGRTIRGIGAAAVYLACRQCRIARTLTEVASTAEITRKDLGRAYRFLRKKLTEDVPLITPEHYVSRFINHLDLNANAEALAVKLIRAGREMQLTQGKGPISIAAAVIYIVSVLLNDRRTQRQIAEVTNITEVTVRNRYKDVIENVEISITV
jgi:transcription initiation factor TFIIB